MQVLLPRRNPFEAGTNFQYMTGFLIGVLAVSQSL